MKSTKSKYIPLHSFTLLKDSALQWNQVLFLENLDGYTSLDVLYKGSMQLPRKKKKKIRSLIKAYYQTKSIA